jgi:3D (Asp-Asp-Asp) domain-containing protein
MRYFEWTLIACLLIILFSGGQQNKDLRSMVKYSQADRQMLFEELQADDAILQQIFDGQWDRSRPVLSVPVTVSCYTSRVQETDSTPHETADGSLVRRGVIAISPDIQNELGITFGDRIVLDGYGTMEVRDVMNPRWRRRVDIWSSDLQAARLHGVVPDVTMTWLGRSQ